MRQDWLTAIGNRKLAMNHSFEKDLAKKWMHAVRFHEEFGRVIENSDDNSSSSTAWGDLSELAEKDPVAAWRIVGFLYEMSHGKEDLGMIASGPFEDILAAYQGPIENLIGESDSELVGALLPYVWLGRVPSRTREYIIEFAEKRGYPFPGSG